MNYPKDEIRKSLADKYIKGFGIEIGALCHPVETDAVVTYIDRFSVEGLHKQYPDIPTEIMCPVTKVENGETLTTIPDHSQDFVIANHFLEHCEFPIKTIKNWTRILKSGGIIFCAVPNKDVTFDKDRKLTPLDHLIEEYKTGESDTFRHYMDATGGDDMLSGHLIDDKYSIHYHVWDKPAIAEFFGYVSTLFNLQLIDSVYNEPRAETIFILRKL